MGNDKTKWIFQDDGLDDAAEFTENITRQPGGGNASGAEDAPTEQIGGLREETELFFGAGGKPGAASLDEEVPPVVGWLVVIKGPGLGRSLNLTFGVNTLGRDRDEDVALPFGDRLISGRDHAKIIYDDKKREFLIAIGSGRNLTRLNGAIVASPTPLPSHSIIELTETTHLRFVPFCDESFDWSGNSEEVGAS